MLFVVVSRASNKSLIAINHSFCSVLIHASIELLSIVVRCRDTPIEKRKQETHKNKKHSMLGQQRDTWMPRCARSTHLIQLKPIHEFKVRRAVLQLATRHVGWLVRVHGEAHTPRGAATNRLAVRHTPTRPRCRRSVHWDGCPVHWGPVKSSQDM